MKARYIVGDIARTAESVNGRIVVLTGARQTGKTTIVRNGLKDYTYLSIEDPVAADGYARLTASQWRSLYPKAVLDEVYLEAGRRRSQVYLTAAG